MDKSIKLVSILGIAIISCSIFYYLVIFLPQNERAKTALQKQEQRAEQAKFDLKLRVQDAKEQQAEDAKDEAIFRQNMLDAALKDAYDAYKKEWDMNVERLGRTDGTLPDANAESIEKHHREDRQEAFKRWGE